MGSFGMPFVDNLKGDPLKDLLFLTYTIKHRSVMYILAKHPEPLRFHPKGAPD